MWHTRVAAMAQCKALTLVFAVLPFFSAHKHCPGDAGNLSKTFAANLSTDKLSAITPDGLSFRVGSVFGLLNEEQVDRLQSGLWEASTDPWIQQALLTDPHCRRPLFVDAGAAFGYYSLRALQTSCRVVHAFNPHPVFAGFMR